MSSTHLIREYDLFSYSYRMVAKMYLEENRIMNAIYNFRRAIGYNFYDMNAHVQLGTSYLLLGNFLKGWEEIEWRPKLQRFMPPIIPASPSSLPYWSGESIENKILLVNQEQGIGDAIQFVRYIPLLKAQGATVILGCQKPLQRLFAGMADIVLTDGDSCPCINLHTFLMSLPFLFKTTLETIPNRIPYLSVPPEAGKNAVSIISNSSKYRVGLFWQGHTNRTLSLRHLVPLLNIPNIQFFSLQKGRFTQEIKMVSPENVIDLDPHLDDFADTAAAIEALDLVISIDTAVAHLAGALGKPVWTLIPFPGEWRWLQRREDSPWYPTMRLFRQIKPEDWESVIARVAQELTKFAERVPH